MTQNLKVKRIIEERRRYILPDEDHCDKWRCHKAIFYDFDGYVRLEMWYYFINGVYEKTEMLRYYYHRSNLLATRSILIQGEEDWDLVARYMYDTKQRLIIAFEDKDEYSLLPSRRYSYDSTDTQNSEDQEIKIEHFEKGELVRCSSKRIKRGNIQCVINYKDVNQSIIASSENYYYDFRGNLIRKEFEEGEAKVVSYYNEDKRLFQEDHFQSGELMHHYVTEFCYGEDGDLESEFVLDNISLISEKTYDSWGGTTAYKEIKYSKNYKDVIDVDHSCEYYTPEEISRRDLILPGAYFMEIELKEQQLAGV